MADAAVKRAASIPDHRQPQSSKENGARRRDGCGCARSQRRRASSACAKARTAPDKVVAGALSDPFLHDITAQPVRPRQEITGDFRSG